MVGVIFYELFIVFGLPPYYTAIKSSSIPTHILYNSRFHVYTLFICYCCKIYITHLPIHQIIHTLCLPCFNYKIPKPLRKMNRLIPWQNLCNFVICVHVKMKLFEWNDVKLHSNERLRQFWVVVLINSFSFKIYLSTIN